MKYWMIERELESGGAVGIGINHHGYCYYAEYKKECAKFADERTAKNYLEYCKNHLQNKVGQKGYKVVETEDEN